MAALEFGQRRGQMLVQRPADLIIGLSNTFGIQVRANFFEDGISPWQFNLYHDDLFRIVLCLRSGEPQLLRSPLTSQPIASRASSKLQILVDREFGFECQFDILECDHATFPSLMAA